MLSVEIVGCIQTHGKHVVEAWVQTLRVVKVDVVPQPGVKSVLGGEDLAAGQLRFQGVNERFGMRDLEIRYYRSNVQP